MITIINKSKVDMRNYKVDFSKVRRILGFTPKYSVLNIFGIAPKFIPLSFLISLMIFILKHLEDPIEVMVY